MLKSLRLQLTAWYLLFFTLLLVGFSAFLYTLLRRNLQDRLDASLAGATRTAARLFESELGENHGDAQAGAAEALVELRFPNTWLAIFEGEQLLAASHPQFRKLGGLTGLLADAGARGQSSLATVQGFGANGARVLVLPFQTGGRRCFLAAAEPLDLIEEQLKALRQILYLSLPAAILLAGLGGYLLATKSLAPVVAMAEQAERITAQNLHKRLEIGNAGLEISRLARVFNELLSRLDRSFERMRQFTADASHELRTPLAVIRGEADVALSQGRRPAEYRETLGIIQDEAVCLSRLVEDLLNLARRDAGHCPLEMEDFYLNDLVEVCCRAAQRPAERKGVRLAWSCPADVSFRGDPELLRRLILNLLDNATRFTPPGGAISVELEIEGANARIVVADTGIGIPAESAERVFERFYRVDKARSRAEGGFGLGLAIVKWIAEAHQGSVHLTSRPEAGSAFTVLLPLEGSRVTVGASAEATPVLRNA